MAYAAQEAAKRSICNHVATIALLRDIYRVTILCCPAVADKQVTVTMMADYPCLQILGLNVSRQQTHIYCESEILLPASFTDTEAELSLDPETGSQWL